MVYQIIHGSTQSLPDVESFIAQLNSLDLHPFPAARSLFEPGVDLFVTRAPGRLDVMGGIADYSGSLVLQLPIREATLVALQPDPAPLLRLVSPSQTDEARTSTFEMPLADLERAGQPVDYATAQSYFRRDPRQQWAAYAAGAFLVLRRELGVSFSGSARLLITSAVPEGSGVSSSAAVEVAVMQAIAAAFDLSLSPRQLALLCQMVENLVVGAPCSIMDQMTAVCGATNRLLALRCQPAELKGMVTIPGEIAIWGLDSGERHSVSGAAYTTVRVAAFMGYRLIAEQAGLSITPGSAGEPGQIADPRWGGYLANVAPSEFEQYYAADLPEQISGREFLSRYGTTTDPVAQIDPNTTYPVRVATAHPIYEHFRVRTFAELLGEVVNEQQLRLLGELMYQSHASYSACGLGAPGTNRLVELVRAAGSRQGLYGAKITGGGSGGTVAVLGRQGSEATIEAIVAQYAAETGYRPQVFSDSSPGAAEFGYLRLGDPFQEWSI